MTSQKNQCNDQFTCISYINMFAMKVNSFFQSDLKVVLYVTNPTSLEGFTSFLLRLIDFDDFAIFKFCFEYFSKDSYHMFKSIVSKTKANYKRMLLVHKEKNHAEIIKIDITKLLFR